jgi:hypothetical protein
MPVWPTLENVSLYTREQVSQEGIRTRKVLIPTLDDFPGDRAGFGLQLDLTPVNVGKWEAL